MKFKHEERIQDIAANGTVNQAFIADAVLECMAKIRELSARLDNIWDEPLPGYRPGQTIGDVVAAVGRKLFDPSVYDLAGLIRFLEMPAPPLVKVNPESMEECRKALGEFAASGQTIVGTFPGPDFELTDEGEAIFEEIRRRLDAAKETCRDCDGGGFAIVNGPHGERKVECPACKGTGVGEDIPPQDLEAARRILDSWDGRKYTIKSPAWTTGATANPIADLKALKEKALKFAAPIQEELESAPKHLFIQWIRERYNRDCWTENQRESILAILRTWKAAYAVSAGAAQRIEYLCKKGPGVTIDAAAVKGMISEALMHLRGAKTGKTPDQWAIDAILAIQAAARTVWSDFHP